MSRGAVKKIKQAVDWMQVPTFKCNLSPATGTGKFWKTSAKSIRFCKKGCANRPFYQIVVMERRKNQFEPVIEQVGTYDPMPNQMEQIMVSLNYERIRHWIGEGAHVSSPVAKLLGLSGLYPIYPKTYMDAWRNRAKQQAEVEAAKSSSEEATPAV